MRAFKNQKKGKKVMNYQSPSIIEMGKTEEIVRGHTPIQCEFHGLCSDEELTELVD
jgi:hypothetical protein